MQIGKCRLCGGQGKGRYYSLLQLDGVKKDVFVCKRCRDGMGENEEGWKKAADKALKKRMAKRDT